MFSRIALGVPEAEPESKKRGVHAHVPAEAHATRTVSIVVAAMSCRPERPVAHIHTHARQSGCLFRMLVAEPRKCLAEKDRRLNARA